MSDMKTEYPMNEVIHSYDKFLDSLAITSVMLYSDNEDFRYEYVCKTLFRHIADENALTMSSGLPKKDIHNYFGIILTQCAMEVGGWTKFYEWVTRFRKEPLEKDFEERLARGIISGEILSTALFNKISISKAIHRIVDNNQNKSKTLKDEEKLNIDNISINITESNLGNNIWPKYKKAAHLWASFRFFSPPPSGEVQSRVFLDIEALQPRNPQFPMGGIDGFLRMAGHILKSATAFKPPRSAKPLLEEDCDYAFFRGVTPS